MVHLRYPQIGGVLPDPIGARLRNTVMTAFPLACERAGGDAASPVPADYAPHPLVTDETVFGLDWRQFVTRLGVVSARVSPVRRSGTATVLLHGAAGSWSTWTPLLAEARACGLSLADLVIIDLPGWGDSPLEADPAALAPTARPRDAQLIEAYSCTVVEVLHSLGYRDWHLIGHSMGAFIALDLAATEPGATLSAGLVSPSTFSVAAAVRNPLAGLVRRPAFLGLYTVMRLFGAHGEAASALLRALDRIGLLRLVVSPLFARVGSVPRSVVSALAAEVRPAAFVRAAQLATLYDFEGSYARIRCPVISVRGADDAFVTADDDESLARLLGVFTSSVLPSTGHFGQIEAPDAVLSLFAEAFSPRS